MSAGQVGRGRHPQGREDTLLSPGESPAQRLTRGTQADPAQNEFFKERLQPEIMPALLADKIIEPNKQRIVEGASMVERAQNALSLLRSKTVSGERLVWKVSD